MKNIIKLSSAIVAMAIFLVSCQKGFDELNVNPNDPSIEFADPAMILTPVLKDGVLSAHLHQRIHNIYIDNYAQYYNCQIAGVQRGNINDSFIQDYWKEYYKWLNSLNTIIRLNGDNELKANIVAMAKIYRAFLTSRTSDLFGDIPYSKAADGSGEIPEYDTQESIYKNLLKDLADAVGMLDGAKEIMTADFIYAGDVDSWKKFGNSLRLRLAMRISKVEPDLAKENAEAAVAGGVFEVNGDSALMVSDGSIWGQGYSTKYYFDWGSGNGVGLTTTMYNMLVGYEMDFPGKDTLNDVPEKIDPRALHYFDLTNQNSDISKGDDGKSDYINNWTGLDNGLSLDSLLKEYNFIQNNSRVGAEMQNIERPFIIMPASEVWFLRAEGTERFGWDMGETAQKSYEEGITLSMMQWKEEANTDTYITSTNPNENGTTVDYNNDSGRNDSKLDKIITQKYISGFPDNGWEAWADQRRLDHNLIQAPLSVDPGTGLLVGGYVQRIKYPSTQQSVNQVNYAEAVRRQGADLVSTEVWWAKE